MHLEAELNETQVSASTKNAISDYRPVSSLLLAAAARLAGSMVLPLPLDTRKTIARWIVAKNLPGRQSLPIEMFRDWARDNPEECYRFIWSNHLGYALTYEPSLRFGNANLRPSRRMLFHHLTNYLRGRGIQPETDIHSVFDVGCSLGYVLRYLETDLFISALDLHGIDIDQHAIQAGTSYLRQVGSKVKINIGDMGDVESVMGGQIYDIVLCCGTLLYLQENNAARAITSMLRHARYAVALSGLAHPDIDNSQLERSFVRKRDGGRIHNFDRIVRDAGGTVAFRLWGGRQLVQRHSVYFIIAEPRAGLQPRVGGAPVRMERICWDG